MGRGWEACLLSLEQVGLWGVLACKLPRLLKQGSSLQDLSTKEPTSKACQARNKPPRLVHEGTSLPRLHKEGTLAAKYPKWDVLHSGPHYGTPGTFLENSDTIPVNSRTFPEPKNHFPIYETLSPDHSGAPRDV